MKTRTKGNVVVEDIKIGDVHYEYSYGVELKTTVKTLPVKEERDDDNYWSWKSETDKGKIVEYGVSDKYAHYGPNLYTYPAYRPIDQWSEEDFKKMKDGQ